METLLTLSKETRCRNHLKGIAETFLTYTVLSISFEVEVPTGKVTVSQTVLKKRAQQCLPRFLWRGCNFGTCESLGSCSVKMSQAFHDPSMCFNILYFHRKINMFETPEMCLLRLRRLSRMFCNYFCGIFLPF